MIESRLVGLMGFKVLDKWTLFLLQTYCTFKLWDDTPRFQTDFSIEIDVGSDAGTHKTRW